MTMGPGLSRPPYGTSRLRRCSTRRHGSRWFVLPWSSRRSRERGISTSGRCAGDSRSCSASARGWAVRFTTPCSRVSSAWRCSSTRSRARSTRRRPRGRKTSYGCAGTSRNTSVKLASRSGICARRSSNAPIWSPRFARRASRRRRARASPSILRSREPRAAGPAKPRNSSSESDRRRFSTRSVTPRPRRCASNWRTATSPWLSACWTTAAGSILR